MKINKISIAFFLAFLFPILVAGGQTMPSVDDPRIEARFIYRSEMDQEAIIEQDIIGENAINVLIIGEGFTENSKEKFFSYCFNQGAFFIERVPLSEKFNLVAIWLPSVDDGIDIPEEGVVKDTPLDSYYDEGFYEVRKSLKAKEYLARFLRRKEEKQDFLVITINDNRASGFSAGIKGSYAVLPLETSGVQDVLTHELGHLIAGLADEYLAVGSGESKQTKFLLSEGGVVNYPNLIGNINWPKDADGFPIIPKEDIPWADLIKEDTPIPTTKLEVNYFREISYDPLPGFEKEIGCHGIYNILFAPRYGGCIMDSPGQEYAPNSFCPVCQRQWKKEIGELLINRPAVITKWSASGISEDSQPFADTLTHNFYWEMDGEWFYATGFLLRNPWGDDRAFLQISIPELSGTENKKEYWNVVSENVSPNPDPVLGWDIIDQNLTQEFGMVVFVRSDININQMSQFRVEVNLPEFGKFTVKSALDQIIKPEPTPTPTPILPTPTPIPPTPTPIPQVSVSNVMFSSLNGKVSVSWQANANPEKWEIHLYRFNEETGENEFLTRKDPQTEGSIRMVEFPEVKTSGRYQAFVSPVVGGEIIKFVPSPPFKWQSPDEPTPTPIETGVNNWLLY